MTSRVSTYLLLCVGLAIGALAACFTPPSGDVLFACEFDGDDTCPADYACEADDCCHRVGSAVQPNEGNWGSCALGGNSGDSSGETSGGPTDTDTTDESGSDTGSGTETGTDSTG